MGKVPPASAKKEYNEKTARGALKYIAKNMITLIQRDISRLGKLELLAFNAEIQGTDEDTSEDEYMDSKDDVPKEVGSEEEEDNEDDEH